MARKKKNTRRTRVIRKTTKWGNTRFKKARQNSLRFSPYKPIEISVSSQDTQPSTVRRERPQRSEKPKKRASNYLTLQTVKVHTDDRRTRVCKRRAERKEIIHALGKSGSGGQKKPDIKNRNIKC